MAEEVVRIRFESVGGRRVAAETRAIGNAAKGSSTQVAGLGAKGRKAGGELRGAFAGAVSPVNQLKTALVGLGAALGGRAILGAINEYQTLRNRIAQVTKSQAELNQVYGRVKQIALNTNSGLGATAVLYQRTAQAAKELGKSQNDALGLTESISNAVKLSGVEAETAANGIRQFAQGLAKGRLDGEELKSVLENLPRLAIALADGLGTKKGQLTTLGAAGELTPQAIFDAMKKVAPQLVAEAEKMQITLSQAFQNVQTQWTDFIGSFGEGSGLSSALTSGLVALADNLQLILSALIGFGSAWAIAKAGAMGYAGAMIAVGAAQKGFAVALAATRTLVLGAAIGMKTMSVAQFALATATATATGALKLFRLALVSTGVGAIVVGLGLAITWLINFGNTTEDIAGQTVTGWEKIKVAMSVVGDLFQPLLDGLNWLLDGWSIGWDAITGMAMKAVDTIIRAATGAGRAIKAIASGDLTGAWGAATSAFSDEQNILQSSLSGIGSTYDQKLAEYLKTRPASTVPNLDAPLGAPPPPTVDSKAGAAAEKKTAAVKKAIDDMVREKEALQELVDAHGQSQFAINKLTSEREAENKIREQGIESTSKSAQAIRKETDEMRKLNMVIEANSMLSNLKQEKDALIEMAEARNMSAIAIQKLTAAREMENQLNERGIDLKSAEADQIRKESAEVTNLQIAKDSAGEIRGEFEEIVPSFDRQAGALVKWRDDTKAALIAAGHGWEQYADQVDVVFEQRLKDAYMKNLELSTAAADGIQRGLLKISEENADIASMTEDVVKKSFKGMEDALVEFTKTGKLSFKGLADSILEDITRMTIRSQITGPLAEWLSGGTPGATGQGGGGGGVIGSLLGGAGSFIKDLFGFGGGSEDTAKTAATAASGAVGHVLTEASSGAAESGSLIGTLSKGFSGFTSLFSGGGGGLGGLLGGGGGSGGLLGGLGLGAAAGPLGLGAMLAGNLLKGRSPEEQRKVDHAKWGDLLDTQKEGTCNCIKEALAPLTQGGGMGGGMGGGLGNGIMSSLLGGLGGFGGVSAPSISTRPFSGAENGMSLLGWAASMAGSFGGAGSPLGMVGSGISSLASVLPGLGLSAARERQVTGGGSGIGSLFGFANGGSFTVGGTGGTDSQMVAFRATPGEMVDVRTPEQAGSGVTIVNNFTIHAPNGVPRETQMQIARRTGQAARSAIGRS